MFSWFTADEEFGQNPGLCDFLQDNRIPYVMAVPKNTSSPTRKDGKVGSTTSRHGSTGTPGNAARAGSDRKVSESTTGRCSTRANPTVTHDPTQHRQRRTRVLPLLQSAPRQLRRTGQRGRGPLAH
ncbi:MAG: hypothetical protein JO100_12715 [Pseudonocardia sp.]|nr:hypothetical protein [Pseudonocardia sp.]